jgi:hypothetical protein
MSEPDGAIDYSRLSRGELNEALSRIDRDAYPLNYANLLKELDARGPLMSEPPTAPQPVDAVQEPPGKAHWVMALIMLGVTFVVRVGMDDTVSMDPIFGVVVPAATGAIFVGWCIRRIQRVHPERDDKNWTRMGIQSPDNRLAVLTLGAVCVAALIAYVTRDAIRTLGAALGGPTHALEATVSQTRQQTSPRGRNRCLEQATFASQGADPFEICVRHRYRGNLIDSELHDGESVTLIIQRNLIGDSIVGIVPQPIPVDTPP